MFNGLGEPGSNSDASLSAWAKMTSNTSVLGTCRPTATGHGCVQPAGLVTLALGFPKECSSNFVFESCFF